MNWLNTNFPNWRSFMTGIALAAAFAAHGYLLEGKVHTSTLGVSVLIAVLGFVVKDKVVTGGSVSQTAEASTRVETVGTNKPGSPFPPIQTKGLGMMLFALLFSATMIFTVAACGKRVEKIVNIPPGISEEQTQNWYAATGALSVVSDQTKAATDLLVDLEHNGEVPAGDAYQTALSVMGRIAQGGIVARNLLYQQPEHFTESTRNQIVSFAADAIAQLAKINLSTPATSTVCEPGKVCTFTTPSSTGVAKVNDSLGKVKKALQELQAIPGPSHTDSTSSLSPLDTVLSVVDGVVAMRRAEGLLLIGRI